MVCRRPDERLVARVGVRRRAISTALVLLSVTLAVAACAPSAPPGEAALPGPGLGSVPERASRAREVQEACEGCHVDIAAEWRASFHARSFTNAAFQASLAEENLPFCRRCHAPEAPPETWPPEHLAAIGVGCATCHLAGQAILAAPATSPEGPPRESPHAVVRDARFATEAACAGCHEFQFPAPATGGTPEKMQLTITEHEVSSYSDTACAGCHMPAAGEGAKRHRSHAFLGSRSPAAQAQALRVEASRSGASVRVALAPGEVGHAFPTGDLFRRLAVRAEAVTAEGALVAREVRYLARHFQRGRAPNGAPWIALAWDDRPGAPGEAAAGASVELDLGPAAAGRLVHVQVVFERVAKVLEGRPESSAPVESEALLFEAALPPGGPPSRHPPDPPRP